MAPLEGAVNLADEQIKRNAHELGATRVFKVAYELCSSELPTTTNVLVYGEAYKPINRQNPTGQRE